MCCPRWQPEDFYCSSVKGVYGSTSILEQWDVWMGSYVPESSGLLILTTYRQVPRRGVRGVGRGN